MPLTVLDPRTGTRVTLPIAAKQTSERRARNWVLRELDRIGLGAETAGQTPHLIPGRPQSAVAQTGVLAQRLTKPSEKPTRVEAHLVVRRALNLQVGEGSFALAEGESLHTDNAYKHDPEGLRLLAAQAGWTLVRCWIDRDGLSSLHLLRP